MNCTQVICLCNQIMSYTQLARLIKMPMLYATSGFSARIRMVLEPPARRNYLHASYAPSVSAKDWARDLNSICEQYHYTEGM